MKLTVFLYLDLSSVSSEIFLMLNDASIFTFLLHITYWNGIYLAAGI